MSEIPTSDAGFDFGRDVGYAIPDPVESGPLVGLAWVGVAYVIAILLAIAPALVIATWRALL